MAELRLQPRRIRVASDYVPAALIVAGILFSLYLASFIEEGIFYSGDGGMKWLMVKQFAQGDFSVHLHSQHADWVKKLWEAGCYPFQPPFVYKTPEGRLVSSPFLFQALSAPFYLIFGMKGIYLIPMAALWLLWLRFRSRCKRIGITGWSTAAALSILTFASPLILYGAIFWEHTLSVLLTFFALEFFLSWDRYSPKKAFLWGMMAALSVWIRPEALLLFLILSVLLLVGFMRNRARAIPLFLLGVLITTALFFLVNMMVYGHPLGAHSFQVLKGAVSLSYKIHKASLVRKDLLKDLFLFFPVTAWIVAATPLLHLSGRRYTCLGLLVLVIVFIGIAPFFLPNAGGKQWGPRYLLVIIPFIAMLAAQQMDCLLKQKFRSVRTLYFAGIVVCIFAGAHRNLHEGSRQLSNDYAMRVKPVQDAIGRSDVENVIINSQFAAQELAVYFDKKNFFLLLSEEDRRNFLAALKSAGVKKVLYLSLWEPQPGSSIVKGKSGEILAEFANLGNYGIFDLSEGIILQNGEGRTRDYQK